MKSVFFLLMAFLICNSLFQCSNEGNADFVCFEYDQRACDRDQWAESVPSSDSQSEQELKMEAYLEMEGMDIKEVSVVSDFHDSICYACYTCPTGDHFYIQINEDDVTKLDAMNLLNLSALNCGEVF